MTIHSALVGVVNRTAFEVNAKKQPVVDASAVSAENAPCTFAYSLKLEGFNLDIQPDAVVEAPKTEMVHD